MTEERVYGLVAVPNLNRAASIRQLVLETLKLDVVLVRDGDDALQTVADRGLPALLIVDLSLPRVDGFTVIRKMRRHPAGDAVRIIVVAAHESLLAAARELAQTLGISHVLPLDVEYQAWPAILGEALPDLRLEPSAVPVDATPAPRPALTSEVEAVIERAAIEVRRRFHAPIAIGYARIGNQETLSCTVAARESEQPVVMGDINEFKFLRQVAESADPLIIPRVDDHPVFAERLARSARPIRGFAAVPVVTHRTDVRAALCILDTKPVTLSASEIDAFAAYGRSIAQELDGVSSPLQEPRASIDMIEDVKALQHLAATDPLTGLANRRGGEKHIASEIARAKREKRPLSAILLDIDRFKQVNDTFGHQAGDQLLRDVSSILRRTIRAYDVLVRWGGEEFLLVLPGVDLDLARVLADRVRHAVESMDTHGIGPVTLSAGVARFDADYDFASTLRTADQRLYQAKAQGRNRVV
jgi:diguanylate cyclase (GGDEF)-like protein